MTWADQQILNKFASENNRRHALKAEIAALKVRWPYMAYFNLDSGNSKPLMGGKVHSFNLTVSDLE